MSNRVFRISLTALLTGAQLVLTAIAPVFAQESPGASSAPQSVQPPDAGDAGGTPAGDADPRAAERNLWLEDSPAAAPAAPSSTGSVLRVLLTLALAALAIYGVVYFVKRIGRRAEVRDPFLKILASAHLGGSRFTHVVAVGSKAWLLGAAEQGVSLIAEIEDKDILNAMFLEESRRSAGQTPGGPLPGRILDFKTLLRRFGMPARDDVPGADNIRKRRERLKGL